MNPSNLLTAARLLASVPAIWAILNRRFLLALLIVFLCGVSDSLDGVLARRRGEVTRLGTYLDPVADKLLLSGSYLAMGLAGVAPWWLVVMIFVRDVLILLVVGLIFVLTSFRGFAPSLWGKVSTVVQVITAVLLLVAAGWRWTPVAEMARMMTYIAGLATAWSGLHYLGQAVRWLGQGGCRLSGGRG